MAAPKSDKAQNSRNESQHRFAMRRLMREAQVYTERPGGKDAPTGVEDLSPPLRNPSDPETAP